MADRPPGRPPTRTFKPRRRALSPSRQAVYERLAPEWLLAETGPLLDLDQLFGDRHAKVLEIGIGGGETTVAMAVAQRDIDVIGVDVHTPGIAVVLAAIEQHQLTNVRLVQGDVLEFLPRVPPRSLAGIRVFFPDPWPKPRQQHKRLIKQEVVDQLVDRLGPGGWLHLATDIDDYARQMRSVCDAHPRLTGSEIARPEWRPVTRFEQRGIDEGRVAIDLWYQTTLRA
jgi:tRNA (guanine-N7-)-methyltransferase